jgi:NADH:ubiquinone oxidoreductase 27 kD subunit
MGILAAGCILTGVFPGLALGPINSVLVEYGFMPLNVGLSGVLSGPGAWNATGMQEVCYHFELDGVIYNMTVTLNGEWPTVPSITPLFANADWHEREMMELYGIQVTGHPNPTRLFLDEELDAGILNEAVPLSIMAAPL